MRPVNWRELVTIAEDEDCILDRMEGSHYIMTKPGLARPVVIPMRSNLHERIIFNTARTLGLRMQKCENVF